MLLPRILTALALLALLIPALLAGSPLPFAALTLLLIGAGGWEWARLNALKPGYAVGFGALVAGLCAAAWQSGAAQSAPAWVWWLATTCWVLGGGLALRAGPQGWPVLSMPARLLLGAVVLCAAWLALAAARAQGLNFILSTLCVVWMADIAAYFGGRAFGRRKLALAISPGKSWEGVWSGGLGVVLLALLWLALEARVFGAQASVFAVLLQRLGWFGGLMALLSLVGLGVMGDLIESLAKRAAGAKDSSGLLPGHGGVLDRVDALLPVLPAAMALCSL